MFRKGDSVVFFINEKQTDEKIYVVSCDEYTYKDTHNVVVDLEGYSGEVSVDYLKRVIL